MSEKEVRIFYARNQGRSLKISCHPRVAYRSYPILSLQILTLILYLVYASHENDF